MNIFELDESLRTENPCWKGYHPVGTKKKNGRTVPNCVPNANEGVAEAINPDITNPEFSHQQQIGDYLYVARYWSKGLKITAYDGAKKIGYAELMYQTAPFDDFAHPKTTPKRVWLESEWTHVDPKYQRQGIMSTMYAYAKMLGNSVKPSSLRSPDAKAAWASWRQSGDAKHLTSNEGVAEGFKNTYNVGDRVDGPLGTGTIVAVSKNVNVDGRVKVKLDDPSRAGEDGKYKDSFVLDTTQLKHISEQGIAEGDNEKIGGRYGPEDWDAMVRRVGQRAKQGPLKTVYDPEKRVYKNVPAKDKQVKETGNSISLTMNDGSTRFVRSGSAAAGAVKSILNYLVRSKDFKTLRNLKAIDGHDVTGIVSKIFKPSNTIDLGEALDTEFQNFLKQAKHRYPDSKDETEAFMRFVHAELEKEGRIDRNQAQDIDYLEAKIDILIQDLSKISKTPSGL